MSSTDQQHVSFNFIATQASDFEALVAIRIEAMQESLERIGRFDPTRARERFHAGFSPEHTQYIEVNGERVGFVVIKWIDNDLLLDHFYIRPIAQGKNIGSAVLAHIFTQADSSGRSIRVGALRDSDSNRFYVRHGFQLTEHDEFDNYYIRHSSKSE